MTAIAMRISNQSAPAKTNIQRKSELLLATAIIARSTSLIFSKMALGTLGPFNLLALRKSRVKAHAAI